LRGTEHSLIVMPDRYTSVLSESPQVPALLKCIQINLRHSSLASSSLSQIILDLDIDVVLIQEP
jgi:hypothetical protein